MEISAGRGRKDAEIVDKNFGLDGFILDSAGTGPGVVNDIGSSYVVGIGAGTRFSPMFRGDVVYSYRGGYELDDTDQFGDSFSGDITSHSVMANVYWDIPLQMTGFQPFVGAGVGWAGNRMKDISTADGGVFLLPEGETSNFAWQAMAGVSFAVSPQAAVMSSTGISTAGNCRWRKERFCSTTAHLPGRIPALAAN